MSEEHAHQRTNFNDLKTELQQVLLHVSEQDIDPLMDALAEETIEIIQPPETGLVMMTAQDCHECNFYLGEVQITEAEVKYRGSQGHGRITGNEPEKALLLATVEALIQKQATSLLQRINRLLNPLRKQVSEKLEKESRMAAATRVNFESMTEEDI